MQDFFYNIGYYIIYAIPITIALVCLNKIIKNRAEIKKIEEEKKDNKSKK